MSLPALENNMLVPGFTDALDISNERAIVKDSVDASAGPGGQAAIGSFMLAMANIVKSGLVTQKVINKTGSKINKGSLLAIDVAHQSWDPALGAIAVAKADSAGAVPALWVAHEDIPANGTSDVTCRLLLTVAQDISEEDVGAPVHLASAGAFATGAAPATGYTQFVGFIHSTGTGAGTGVVAFNILPPFRYTAP